jgi:predicted Co/Zn/Cd cation transporter (cation efflux family)
VQAESVQNIMKKCTKRWIIASNIVMTMMIAMIVSFAMSESTKAQNVQSTLSQLSEIASKKKY